MRTVELRHLVCFALAACGSDANPSQPAGGVVAFADALASRDPAAVWGRLDPEVQSVCVRGLAALRVTDQKIAALQPSDQADARAQTGVSLLDTVDEPVELFALLVQPDAIPALGEGDGHRRGLAPENVVDVADGIAVVKTDAGQEFEVVRDEEGVWRVREPMLTIVTDAMQPVFSNRQRVEEAVDLFGVGVEIDAELRRLGLLE